MTTSTTTHPRSITRATQDILIAKLHETLLLDSRWSNAKIYLSIPSSAKTPYFKIDTIKALSQAVSMDESLDVTFTIAAFYEDKNNHNIIAIIDQIKAKLPKLMIGSIEDQIEILNVIPLEFTIHELISPQAWKGVLSIRVISRLR